MKIAYLIQAHKNIDQIKMLVYCLLGSGQDHYFIHIDKKSDDLYKELLSDYHNDTRVHISEERVRVNWSGFSQVKATLILMKKVYKSKIAFDRVHLMSGEDFPVRSPEYISSFLQYNRDKEYIEYTDIGKYRWRILQYNFFTEYINNRSILIRSFQRFFRLFQKVLPERKNFIDLKLCKGSSWFNISIEAMEYILQFLDEQSDYIIQFSKTACADEHFFQMILLNSEFKDRIVNNNLYYTEWKKGKSSPVYLDTKGIEYAKNNDNILFIRKINEHTADKLSKGCK